MILLVVAAALAAQSGVEDEALGMSLLTRPEPSLAAGVDAMTEGDLDRAIERFRSAQPRTPDEQAAVEYDVGQALLAKALAGKAAADTKDDLPDDVKKSFEEAGASFDRAFGRAQSPRTKSEAALAAGNALAESGDVKGAIDSYRRSVVADPGNQAARENLLRALRYLKAQPPPPPQDGKNDDEKKDEEKKDDEKQDGEQKQDGDGKPEEGDGEPQDGKGEPPPPQDGEDGKDGKDGKGAPPPPGAGDEQPPPKDGQGGQQPPPPGDDEEKPVQPKGGEPQPPDEAQPPPGQPSPATPPPTSKKRADAKRILDALRSRERPLQPLLMRVPPGKLVAPEKDW